MHILKLFFFDLVSHKLLSRLALLACLQFAMYGSQALAFEAPPFQGDVLDEVGIFSETDKDALLSRIREMRERAGILAAIYVTQGLQQGSLEDASVAIFEKWKLGETGKDNGLLVLIVPSERKMRIEVGYGLEANITDALSKRIIDEIYKPAFRDQRFADGLIQGFEVMEQAVSFEYRSPQPSATRSLPKAEWTMMPRYFWLTFGINLVPPLAYLLALAYGRSKGRRKGESLWHDVSLPFTISSILGVTFGMLIAIFGAWSGGSFEVINFFAYSNLLLAILAILPFAFEARRFVFESVHLRHLARIRLIRIRKRSKIARKIFGVLFEPTEVSTHLGGIMRGPRNSGRWSSSSPSSSSDSASSSPSSASSSGGGRSGGGGASGSW